MPMMLMSTTSAGHAILPQARVLLYVAALYFTSSVSALTNLTTLPPTTTTTTAAAVSTTPAPTVNITMSLAPGSPVDFDAAVLKDAALYASTPPMFSLVLANDTWKSTAQLSILTSSSPFDEPNGWGTIPVTTAMTILVMQNDPNVMNVTLPLYGKCLANFDPEMLSIYVVPGSTMNGYNVNPLVEVFMLNPSAITDSMDTFSVLIVASIICGLLFVIFLLDGWCQAIVTLHQLQMVAALTFMPCATSAVRGLFDSTQFVLFPLSQHLGPTHDTVIKDKLIFNLAVTFCIGLFQVTVLTLFHFYGGMSWKEAISKTRFPSALMFCSFALLPGALFAAVRCLILVTTKTIVQEATTLLALSLATLFVALIMVLTCVIILFKVVSKLVYREPQGVSLLRRVVLGGEWTSLEELRGFGVLFEDLHGSSFWFFAAHLILTLALVMTSATLAKTPGGCSNQFYFCLTLSGIGTILAFLRRPFRSVVINFINIGIYGLITIICISYISAATCSAKASLFASATIWLTMVALMMKSVIIASLMMLKRFTDFRERMENGTSGLDAPSSAAAASTASAKGTAQEGLLDSSIVHHNGSGVPSSSSAAAIGGGTGVNTSEMITMTLLPFKSESLIDSAVRRHSMVVDGGNGIGSPRAGGGGGGAQDHRSTIGYRPSLPQPVHLGESILTRLIGFGPSGGISGFEGPSVAIQLEEPVGLCCDRKYLYFVDATKGQVYRHDFKSRRMTPVTTSDNNDGGTTGGNLMMKSAFQYAAPRGLCLGQGCLFVADAEKNAVCRVELLTGKSEVIMGASVGNMNLHRPFSVSVLNNLLYVVDSLKHRLITMDLHSGITKTVVGTGYPGYDSMYTPPAASRLNLPQSVKTDEASGHVIICDTGNHRVVRYIPKDGTMETILGIPGVSSEESAVTGGGDVEISSGWGGPGILDPAVRSVRSSDQEMTTIATAQQPRSVDTRPPALYAETGIKVATTVTLCLPTDAAIVEGGRQIFVVDGGNARIWRINSLGYAHIVVPASDLLSPRCITIHRTAGTVRGGGNGSSSGPNLLGSGRSDPYLSHRQATGAASGGLGAAFGRAGVEVGSGQEAGAGGGDTAEDTVLYVSDAEQRVIFSVSLQATREDLDDRFDASFAAMAQSLPPMNLSSAPARRSALKLPTTQLEDMQRRTAVGMPSQSASTTASGAYSPLQL